MLARKGETNKSGRKKKRLIILLRHPRQRKLPGMSFYFPQQQSEPLNKKNRSRITGAVQTYVSIQEKQQRQAWVGGFIE